MAVDIVASVNAVGCQSASGAIKVWEDLERYERVIRETKPDVVVETGTWRGGSAAWFASQGLDVITIDVACFPEQDRYRLKTVTWVTGDSVDPETVSQVAGLVGDRRVMVVLDSDHSAKHVRAEIQAYGPMVSAGCSLVVEDTIVRWWHEVDSDKGSPYDAVESELIGNSDWIHDMGVEDMHRVTMSPGGWWRRA